MKTILILLTTCLLPLTSILAEGDGFRKLMSLDFTAGEPAMVAADQENKAQGRVTGQVPVGWEDNSAWAKLAVDYKLLEEEGQRYVAMKVDNVQEGYAILRHMLPDYGDGSFFKLSLKVRATAGVEIEFGIRANGAPYKFEHSEKIAPGSTWKTYDYFFTLDRNKQPVGFYFTIPQVGELDLAKLTLEQVSREHLMGEFKNRGSDPANLLRSSRLPLGLQNGWTVSSSTIKQAQEPEIFADPKEMGMSGFPALRFKAQEKVSLYSEPFDVPMPFQKYTASVFVKGTGTGMLDVKISGRGAGSKEFTAGEQWQRVELPFEPRLGEKSYALLLTSTGDLLVDGWQVNAGDKATPYQSQLPVEVALACPAAETGAARVQFSDEAANAEYYVSGNPFFNDSKGEEVPKLHAKVVNLYGEEALIKPIALKNQNIHVGTFDFNLFPKRPLGPFRIEAWVTDASGKRISAYQEMVIYRLARPRYWGKDAPDSPFGAHVEADAAHLQMAKATGNNWVRLHDTGLEWIGWKYLEKTPGQWTFYDEVINRYRRQHLKILGSLSTTPEWARGDKWTGPKVPYWDRFWQPQDLSQFGNYVRKVVERYKGVIDTYEVWNEPWNAAWFARSYDETKKGRAGYKSGDHPQAEYAAITKAANEAAKAVDPGVAIVGINTTTTETNTKPFPDTGGADWSKGLKALNSENDCDIMSYHGYDNTVNGFPGDAVEKGFKVAMGPFLNAGVKKPVWFTEGSTVNRRIASGFYNHTLPYVDAENTMETGNRECRFVLSMLANGVEKIFMYSMGSYGHFNNRTSDWWSSLIAEDGWLHPSAAAFSQMAWQLEDTKFLKIVPVGEKSFAYLFQGKTKLVAVIAPAPQGDQLSVPRKKGWVVRDMLGNQLASNLVTGNTLIYIETAQPPAEVENDLAKLSAKTKQN